MSWLVSPGTLRRQGVMGMNQRNLHFVGRHNPRQAYPLVDNKLRTKRLAKRAGIPMPDLLHEVSRQHQIEAIEPNLSRLDEFVIKPAHGSGGKGILVIASRDRSAFVKSSGERVDLNHIKHLLTNIISGLYSLGGRSDDAIIESLVRAHPMFSKLSIDGVPDIRVIVFKGFPVMAMLRLGTHASDGKANLHQGAIGVGLDLRTGQGAGAVQRNRPLTQHPDTGEPLQGIAIPNWRDLLTLAARCHDVTGLGYLGCDIVIDAEKGPLLLEMNARPGLGIQIANGSGLGQRLKAIEALELFAPSLEERVGYAMNGLGGACGAD
ncbi:MAG: alpha-L-glutamate ligase-like protein [Gammaproteobacteria bacterium]|nr:alpha-L-glutamate ligase-like protein [Gammaproteobacteria bacterium]